MRLISAADFHGKQYRLNQFLEAIDEYSPDLAIVCGDITNFGPGELAKIFLDQIPIKTLAIPGNVDTEDVLEYINKSKAINLHLKRVEINNMTFVGIGGLDTLPFHIKKKSELSDEDMMEKFSHIITEDCILVTHVPPYGIQDSVFLGMHAGSKTIRRLVEKYSPTLHLCGHIHEDPGFSKLGETTVVNCSVGRHGKGAIIDIESGKVDVNMLE